MKQLAPPRHFYSLDVLRGVAALSVVLWHWQHFFLPHNPGGLAFNVDKLPLADILRMFYRHGGSAVELFFSLSGFIFFWLYSKSINEKTMTLKTFSLLRLSRLYPLHFVTLVFVAVMQAVYGSMTHQAFVYPSNDLYHFILNLFFASTWGLENGFSFNAPIWSVSVEVLLYLMFFIYCRLFCRHLIMLPVAILIGLIVIPIVNGIVGAGVVCFFIGGLIFVLYKKIVAVNDRWRVSIWLPIVALFAWMGTLAFTSASHYFLSGGTPWLLGKVASSWSRFFLYPVTIMSLALIETRRGTLGRRVSFLGDISYSTYLLHFPLQLTVVTIATRLAVDPQVFYSAWIMAAFFCVLIPVSLASHRYFEMPMQRYLRRRFTRVKESGDAG